MQPLGRRHNRSSLETIIAKLYVTIPSVKNSKISVDGLCVIFNMVLIRFLHIWFLRREYVIFENGVVPLKCHHLTC